MIHHYVAHVLIIGIGEIIIKDTPVNIFGKYKDPINNTNLIQIRLYTDFLVPSD